MSTGVCLDALNPVGSPSVADLQYLGVTLVRMQARLDEAMYSYHDACLEAGFETAVVLDSDAYPGIDQHASRISPTLWIVGNEMDAGLLSEDSESSWNMSINAYIALWQASVSVIKTHQPSALCVVGGLVSGQPDWAATLSPRLGPRPYAWDIHPYSKGVSDAADLLALYQIAVPEPLMVLEWNRAADEIPAYQTMLDRMTTGSAFFCYSSGMVADFGLLDIEGNLTAEYYALQSAAHAGGGDPVTDEEAMAQITLLQQQQGLQTQALIAALEGRWVGEASVEAYLYALDPTLQGTLSPNPPVLSN